MHTVHPNSSKGLIKYDSYAHAHVLSVLVYAHKTSVGKQSNRFRISYKGTEKSLFFKNVNECFFSYYLIE